MKAGDIVVCKKSLNFDDVCYYVPEHSYKVKTVKVYKFMNENYAYISIYSYNMSFSTFYLNTELPDHNRFDTYFYNKKEMRKLKLEKINEKKNMEV